MSAPAATTNQGFTLLEVMIAVAVIAIALTTLLSSQSQSLSVVTEARFDAEAAMLARKKLTELRLEGFDELGDDNGLFEERFAGYGWKTEVTELTEDAINIPEVDGLLKQVVLTIYLVNDENRTFIVSTTMMGKIEAEEQDG
ncbi:MAG: hypothetical protein CSB34_05340 [Desulfobulbus propionicus]|nr:MAG: hypothetical protein CSB34_05340 [Desulfobulbus propionicus]